MPKINWIEWNGTRSTSFGIFVSGNRSFDAAEADVTAYQIPGRNGDLIVSNKRYKNIEVTYPAFVPSDFETRVQGIRNWMRSSTGYEKLEDSFDTTHFRMARPKGVLKFSPVVENIAANMSLVFDCKPQRYLNSGDTNIDIFGGTGTATNPTQYDAFPIIGTRMLMGETLTITASDGTSYVITALSSLLTYTTIFDCETRNAYYVNSNYPVNINTYYTMTSTGWPVFKAGETYTITHSNSSRPLYYRPRWWEL